MLRYIRYALVVLTVLTVLLAACDDRGRNVPTRTEVQRWEVDPTNRVFSDSTNNADEPELLMQIRNPFAFLEIETYIPIEASSQLVPTLILLAPQGGGDTYFLERGLFQLAHEMIAAGEIQPMMIVCVGNDPTFGGYFYGNSYPAGFYDRVLGDRMVEKLEFLFPSFMNEQQKMGIGGIGQGAYGAFRAAIQNPGVYGSISVADGPLDFDGDGSGGLIPYMSQVVASQGLNPGNFPGAFDSVQADPVTQMFIGGAIAFSPNDTALTYQLDLTVDPGSPVGINITSRQQINDNTTLVDHLIGLDNRDFDFHLPFDGTGSPYQPIWSMWMANNLDSLHENATVARPLDGVNMWIANSPEARLNWGAQTANWIETLRDQFGYAPEVFPYRGYQGYPATDGHMVYDLLKEMLIFHSESFGD
ncbi:hypothetical protein GF420_15180 [candidate division GN15 bacterium]|nr:hypothetical protein [candidate division GN15 bacterium]